MKVSTKNGKSNQNCKVCNQLSPTQVKELESDYLYPQGKSKKELSRKYGINFNDIVAHMDNRKRHREESQQVRNTNDLAHPR